MRFGKILLVHVYSLTARGAISCSYAHACGIEVNDVSSYNYHWPCHAVLPAG